MVSAGAGAGDEEVFNGDTASVCQDKKVPVDGRCRWWHNNVTVFNAMGLYT